MRWPIITLFFTLISWGLASAQDEGQSGDSPRLAEMEKVKGAFRETWVHPDADFTRLNKLYLWDAHFEYRDVGPARRTRSTMMSSRKREFGISDADREEFEKVLADAFVKEIQRAKKFEVVDDVGPGTIIMRGAILDIISRVPPETVGRSEIYLASIGEATLILELLDAETGDVLAVVAERRAMGQSYMTSMPTNNVTILADIRRWARREATTLRVELDKAIAGK